jgi:hypothetical protein
MQTIRPVRPLLVLLAWATVLQLGGAATAVHLRGADGQPSAAAARSAEEPIGVAAQAAAPAVPAVVEVPTTVATPPPAPPVSTAPAPRAAGPAPAPAAAPEPPAQPRIETEPQLSVVDRLHAAYQASVPGSWQSAIPVRLELVEGDTSWADPSGTIQVSAVHAEGSLANLQATLAHEFGHLIAFRYGSQSFNGAAPEGWPAYSSRAEEAWADCVSQAFTGIVAPSHGLAACSGASLDWAIGWLAQGPAAHPVLG